MDEQTHMDKIQRYRQTVASQCYGASGVAAKTAMIPKVLAAAAAIGAMGDGPYSDIGGLFSKHIKEQRGYPVGCHVCGQTRVTLYKDGDQRICKKCREKKLEENKS